MASAKKCDRCGKLYEEYNVKSSEKNANGIRFLNIDSKYGNYAHGSHDLCPECMGELRTWFDNPTEKPIPAQTMHEACKAILKNEKEQDCNKCEYECTDAEPQATYKNNRGSL